MGLFISDPSQALWSGVFAVQISPPTVIEGVSLGFMGLVAQYEWGPAETVYTPIDTVDYLNTFAPPGAPRQSGGYRTTKGRPNLSLKVVRVLHADAVAATLVSAGTGGNENFAAKWKGTLGNNIVVTQNAAASGISTHRDFVVSLTDPVTGTTSESYLDVPIPTGAGNVVVDVSRSLLLASFTLDSAMTVFPANGAHNLTSGTNGSAITSHDYTGTQGSTDAGVALFEAEAEVFVVCHDDCGDTNRTAINDAFVAHADYMGDRMSVTDASPNDADWAAVVAEVTGGIVDQRNVFCGAWTTILDDGGVAVQSPLSSFIANVFCNVPAFQSHAWRDNRITQYYAAINSIVANFSVIAPVVRAQALSLGICLPIKLTSGRYAMQHDRNTNTDPRFRFSITRRINDYLARSLVAGSDAFVNAPNVTDQQRKLAAAIDDFIGRAGRQGYLATDSGGVPIYSVDRISPNSPTTVGLGEFFVAINAQSPSVMEKVFLLMGINPFTVVTTPQ